ncbi:MAG TPA: MT-A70 family methyltransferase [Candidatus Glassbacteria bacterium]|nr:MT-A70 family methyltransferase [Candidatus Glassbacteria bacterium]
MTDKKYQIVYADPPWTFKTYSEKGKERKSPELHYDCMAIEQIYDLPVKDLSSDNCVLFLWVTNPMLEQGLETVKKWGFTYKTIAFSWFKKNKIADSFFWGLGYWTRQNTEHVLLATKGKPTRINKGVHQVIDEDFMYDTEQIVTRLEGHSKKPDIIRNKIVDLCGDIDRIELFARGSFLGWDVWGNEAENPIQWV